MKYTKNNKYNRYKICWPDFSSTLEAYVSIDEHTRSGHFTQSHFLTLETTKIELESLNYASG
jgi:hypothetical protein